MVKKKKIVVMEAMTPSEYAKIRDPYIQKIKDSIANEETEAQRQKRLWIEENMRKNNESLAEE